MADKNDQIKCLIEFQGIQHFYNTDWGKTQREETDQKKKEYCLKNNIPFIEISYKEYKEMNSDYLLNLIY